MLLNLSFPFSVDLIDIVKEQLYGHDYLESEDPKLYISHKTRRGPLSETWLEDYWNEVTFNSIFLPFNRINTNLCAISLVCIR